MQHVEVFSTQTSVYALVVNTHGRANFVRSVLLTNAFTVVFLTGITAAVIANTPGLVRAQTQMKREALGAPFVLANV